MIPKIIHYSWFSTDPMPELAQRCMASWKKYLPGYELVCWDRAKASECELPFLQEALQEQKWAFAADVIRCYAVCTYGGIWLDTDVELFRALDDMLEHKLFIGKEAFSTFNVADSFGHISQLTAHCFGAEAGHPFMKQCLEYYTDRHFITSKDVRLPQSLRYDMRVLPEIMALIAANAFGYCGNPAREEDVERLDDGMVAYPYYVFDMPRYHGTEEVYAIHYQQGGWTQGQAVVRTDRGFRKKDLKYYLFSFLNHLLKSRRLKIRVMSY